MGSTQSIGVSLLLFVRERGLSPHISIEVGALQIDDQRGIS
ncbi:hypothetical protein BH11GEM2_BH11GEM2_26150 [soil metagenome]